MARTGAGLALGLALMALAAGQASARSLDWQLQCAAPAKGDPVIAYSDLYGRPNISDSAWHDDTWAFMEYGPITAMEVYHSGNGWHDPYIGFHPGGEFKGVRPSYGGVTNDLDLLFGARKPHQPFAFALEPGEKIVKVELQHDSVMRWMAFTTNLGHRYEWGFKDQPDAESYVIEAPRPGAYLAAIRGFEGKQLPKELGGYKKRYIIQLGFVWAMPACSGYEWVDARPVGFGGFLSGLFGRRGAGARPPPPAPLPPVMPLGITPAPPMPVEPAPAPAPAPAAVAPLAAGNATGADALAAGRAAGTQGGLFTAKGAAVPAPAAAAGAKPTLVAESAQKGAATAAAAAAAKPAAAAAAGAAGAAPAKAAATKPTAAPAP
ncbi:tyrosine serine phosphatase [Raphidocelis subcapitata]|uniref:Tyrosine serine phosphatase n=1 Tax=Raphidocelis subcapitata TaxID=307507 RepID=A0A2V0NMI3_9CHLO|nr:tyrosine serine phosphatase [Raphidocelis subcapitata]|eukprot:GBF88704.1 tyrosine serine phosphatase [Raphidocelis subcapitata]